MHIKFLVETISLSLVGGLTGIIGGLLCPVSIEAARWLVANFSPKVYANIPEVARIMTPEIVPLSIPLAFGISVVVGVVSWAVFAFWAHKALFGISPFGR